MKPTLILAGFAALAIAASASAQSGQFQRPDRNSEISRQQVEQRTAQRFERMDLDHDGRLTREEARAARALRREQSSGRLFERLDLDGNESISRAEFDQARTRFGERRGARAEGMADRERPVRGRFGRRAHGLQGMRAGTMFRDQGFVSREQFEERALARFDRLDRDGNGVVTLAERRQVFESRREDRRERQPQD